MIAEKQKKNYQNKHKRQIFKKKTTHQSIKIAMRSQRTPLERSSDDHRNKRAPDKTPTSNIEN